MAQAFHYLTGVVQVAVRCPRTLRDQDLGNFYHDPNNAEWGGSLCRVLYHESVHFWQVLASGYLGNLIASEWSRVDHFEKTGEIRPQSDAARAHTERDSFPFSAYELVECWARYWDVHTRSPARIVDEEQAHFEIEVPGKAGRQYTNFAFDEVMQRGPDAALYAAPYRWLLEMADGDSHFAACVFPVLVHAAFGCPNPVRFLMSAVAFASSTSVKRQLIRKSGNINFDWLNNWTAIQGEVVAMTLGALQMPNFTSGFDAIARGPLGTHPVYREYLNKVGRLSQHAMLNKLRSEEILAKAPKGDRNELFATIDLASSDQWVIFAMPGQPIYRYMLGNSLAPPRVQFEDHSIDAARAEPTEPDANGDDSLSKVVDEVHERIGRFRRAEMATRLGLPLNAFEGSGA